MGKNSSPERILSFAFQAIQTFHSFALRIAAGRRGEAGDDLLVMAPKKLRKQELGRTWREPELLTRTADTGSGTDDSRETEGNTAPPPARRNIHLNKKTLVEFIRNST